MCKFKYFSGNIIIYVRLVCVLIVYSYVTINILSLLIMTKRARNPSEIFVAY